MEKKDKITENHIINFVKKKHEEKERLKHMWKASLKEEGKTVVALPTTKSSEAKVRRLPLYAKYAMAASLALLLSVGLYWSFSGSPNFNSPTELAAHYENNFPKPHLDQLKSGTADLLSSIKKEYAANNFQETINSINALPLEAMTNKLLEIRGYCYFQTMDYTKAIADLEKSIENSNHSIDNALWYLALSNLKLQPPNLEKTNLYLKQLMPYKTKQKEAQILMEAIKRMEVE